MTTSVMHLSVSFPSSKCMNDLDQPIDILQGLLGKLPKDADNHLTSRPVVRRGKEAAIIRMGDYWVIRYQGRVTILKAVRGLDYLAYLLHHPRREVHVTELLDATINYAMHALRHSSSVLCSDARTARLEGAFPILDSQAKLEYKCRIDELRKDVEEAERYNDFHRACRSRSEMNAIAEQLAAAVGLGGRDRRAPSGAERARSAVTKRIKEAIKRIAKVLPKLGDHLAARIKTGYSCSYNPNPDRLVAWNVSFR